MNIYKTANISMSIVAYVTMLISFFWGLYAMAPTAIKMIFSLGMWSSLFWFPFILIKHNDFSKWANLLLKSLVLIAILQIIRSAFNTDESMYAFGNKWITLFGNEYTALLLLPPIFTYFGTLKYSIILLKRITWIYLVLGALCLLILRTPLSWIAIFGGVFYPYVNKKYQLLLYLAMAEAIFNSLVGENSTRMFFIALGFSFASYILIYIISIPKLTKAFVIIIAIIPILIFLPMLSHSSKELTIFEKAQLLLTSKAKNPDLSTDTRTFLYSEMAEDLSHTNSWLIGKGAYSHYYSFDFDQSYYGKFGRIASEVPFLLFLLRGGILYSVVYFGLLLLAAYNAIWKSRNKLVQAIGIIVIGWYFNSFVGDITGSRFYHLAFFLLVGCCLSNKWQKFTEKDIKQIMKK